MYADENIEDQLDKARSAIKNYEIVFQKELVLRKTLESALSEIVERFETKQALHKDDCFAYKVASKALNARE